MSYFSRFPKITYLFKIGDVEQLRVVRDITLNVRFRTEILSNIALYEFYSMQELDTPEKVANKFYGDSNLHWVIMLANDKFKLTDFPLSEQQFTNFMTNKYGETNHYAQHFLFGNPHYQLPSGQVVDVGTLHAEPVTNWDFEFKLNEDKRDIKIINPQLVQQVMTELEERINA